MTVTAEHALERAQELHRLGVAAGDEGQLARAADLFRQALTALRLDRNGEPLDAPPAAPPAAAPHDRDRDRLAARILTSMALPAYELGRVQAGLDTIEAAERVASRAKFSEVRVLVLVQHGVLLMRAGRPGEALPYLDSAVRLVRFAAPIEQCKIMMNRGDAHHLVGHIRAARADFSRAVELAREHGLVEFEFRNTHNAAYMDYLAGDLPKALQLMPTPAAATSDYARGVVGMDRSKVLLSAGLVTEADEILQQACAALERTDLVQLLAEAELARAETALLADRPALARELSVRAAGRFLRRRNPRWTALAQLVTLQSDAATGLGGVRLVRRAERLAAELDEHGLLDQARLARLIGTELALARPRAGDVVELPRTRRGEPITLRLRVRRVRALLAFGAHDAIRGRREIRTGLDELSDYQAGFGSFDLQTASAAHGVDLASAGVSEALAAGRPTTVLQFLERARAISSRVPSVLPPEDKTTADLLSRLRWLAGTAEEQEAAGRPDEALRRHRTQLEREIQSRSWTLAGPRRVQAVASIQTLQTSLDGGTLLAIFALHGRVHAVVLTDRGCRMQSLADLDHVDVLSRRINADMDALTLTGLPDPLPQSVRQAFVNGVRALDDLLIAPLGLPDTPVVLLPPARLAALPWGHLPAFRGRALTVSPSASTWVAARRRLSPARGRTVAVAGPGLARADGEVTAVAGAWADCQTLTGAAATGRAFLAAMDGAKLVHVAAHGRHQRDSPLFSSIRLADGPVVGYDLDHVRRPPEQVVLSACELGQATVRPGDEALGLTRALLHSGTSTVVAGVAKVSDGGAAALMIDYHRRLSGGASAASALADALTAAPEPVPFVCFGAGW